MGATKPKSMKTNKCYDSQRGLWFQRRCWEYDTFRNARWEHDILSAVVVAILYYQVKKAATVDSQTNDMWRLNLTRERIWLGGDFHMTHRNDASLHALTIVRAQECIRLELSRSLRSRLLVHLGVFTPSSQLQWPQRFVIFILAPRLFLAFLLPHGATVF